MLRLRLMGQVKTYFTFGRLVLIKRTWSNLVIISVKTCISISISTIILLARVLLVLVLVLIIIIEGQDSFIMRQPEDVEAEFGEDDEDVVADAGNNADLYAANQASTELINEGQRRRPRYASWIKTYFIISRLALTKRRQGSRECSPSLRSVI